MKRTFQKRLAGFLLWITGWKLEGQLPDVSKCVIVGAPHTSNWDMFYGLLFRMYHGLNVHFLMKKELFRFPMSILYRRLGGIPVDRRTHQNLVRNLAARIRESDRFYLAITPEGTRQKVKSWKKGFYHIARTAGIPIVLGFVDYGQKVTGAGPVLYPGDDMDKDMASIRQFYQGIQAKYPDRFSLP